MQAPVSEEATIRFGEFELALKSGELRKNGEIVRLQPVARLLHECLLLLEAILARHLLAYGVN